MLIAAGLLTALGTTAAAGAAGAAGAGGVLGAAAGTAAATGAAKAFPAVSSVLAKPATQKAITAAKGFAQEKAEEKANEPSLPIEIAAAQGSPEGEAARKRRYAMLTGVTPSAMV